MHIHTITNQPSFGATYVQQNKYSDKQKQIIDQIKETLSKPSEQFDNKSAEEFYKSKNKIDFFLENSVKYADSIDLAGYYGVNRAGTGVEEAITYKNSFYIGTYDENHPFKPEDIEYGIKEEEKKGWGGLAFGCLTLLATGIIFLGLILAAKQDAQNAKNAAKPLAENIDSTINKMHVN